MEPSQNRAPNAPGHKEDEEGEDRADHALPGFGEDAKPVLQEKVGGPTNDGAQERAAATEEGHDHDLPGGGPVERLDRHDGQAERVERPGQTGEERGEDEREELDAADVVAAGGGAVGVLPDGLEH